MYVYYKDLYLQNFSIKMQTFSSIIINCLEMYPNNKGDPFQDIFNETNICLQSEEYYVY